MFNRKDLRFNQTVSTREKFSKLIDPAELGTVYQEGFTSLSIKEGRVFLSGRELNERELSRGTTVPKIEKEQIDQAVELAIEFKDVHREIFLLVTNSNSSIIYNGPDNIKILGYYDNNVFVFAGQDEELKNRTDVKKLEPAVEIFNRDGMVVMSSENGQPVTVISSDTSYYYVTNMFEKAKEKIKNNIADLENNKFIITEYQTFLYILSTSEYSETENILSKISNDIKRQKYQKIKENFYYFYTIISPEVLEGIEKLFLTYVDEVDEREDLAKTWRSVFANVRNKYRNDRNIDVFKKLVEEPITRNNNVLAKLCKLCVKFDPKKHNLREVLSTV